MEAKKHNTHWWRLLVMLLLVGTTVALNSCGDDDEPKSMVIDYYINVEEEFLVNGTPDHSDRYQSPLTRMRNAVRTAYPEANAQGADDAVMAACDREFETYKSMYTGMTAEHLTCLMHLVRVNRSGDIIRQSETLRTYVYNINPIEETED